MGCQKVKKKKKKKNSDLSYLSYSSSKLDIELQIQMKPFQHLLAQIPAARPPRAHVEFKLI